MTRALRSIAVARWSAGIATVIVEVTATRGSVPREAGTRMLVGATTSNGTIGGGRLEWDAIARARQALDDPSHWPVERETALGAALGQCCGGAVTLRYRRLDAASLAAWVETQHVPFVQVHGAGHVGRSVVHLLETLDVRVQWIDEREAEFPVAPSAAHIERVCVEPVEAEVDGAPAGAFYLVLTHRHDVDLRIVEAVMRRGDFAFLGLIGSLTKRRRFLQLLRDRGIDDAALARLTCPIGLDGIAGKEPARIAIGVAAQLLPLIDAWIANGGASSNVRPAQQLRAMPVRSDAGD